MLRRCLLLTVVLCGALAAPASATITVSSPRTGEGGTLTYTVTRTSPLETATAATGSGTATPDVDYKPRSDVGVVFSVDGSAEVTVETEADAAAELDETVPLIVTPSLGSPVAGVGVIADDDPPSLSVGDTRASESAGFVDVPVARTPVSRPTRVSFSLATGTATAGADFDAAAGEVTIPPNAGRGVIRIPVVNDTVDEEDETFGVAITAVDPATVDRAAGTATVANDDLRSLSIADAAISEGDGAESLLRVPVSLSGPTFRTVTAQFATADLTAKSPRDYVARIGTLTIPPGQTQGFVDVTIVSDDVIEKPEQLAIYMGRQTGAAVARGVALVRIADDDALQGDEDPPQVKVARPRRSGRALSVRLTCPKAEKRCASKVTFYAAADRASPVKRLRTERRLGRRTVTLTGGASKTVKLTIPKTIAAAARRAGRLKVRAYIVTEDANANTDTTVAAATVRFRR